MAKQPGKGGLTHRQYQHKLAEQLRAQDIPAFIEAYVGKNIDVLAIDSGTVIGVEIQRSPKHCLQVKSDLELGCDEVWVVCENKKVLDKIIEKLKGSLSKSIMERISFYLIEELLTDTTII